MVVELVLEASHPRIAGIVQTHRQHIDAQHWRHGVMTKDIDWLKVSARRFGVKRSAGFCRVHRVPPGSAGFRRVPPGSFRVSGAAAGSPR